MYKFIKEFIDQDEFQLILLKDKVNIINYKELLQINEKQIIVTSDKDKILINGEKLVLKKLLDDEILIMGHINSIGVSYE